MKKIVSFGILLLFLTGCSMLHNLGFRSYNNNFTENLKGHTRSFTLYRDFATIAMTKATHFNKNLMEQYIEYTQNITLSKNKDKKYTQALNDFDGYDIFWVAFYTDDDDINNLANKDSFWNIYLVRDGKTMAPASIKEVDLNSFKKQWLYLVKSHGWSREYIIKFKKPKKTIGRENLVISSYLGTINFNFDN